MKLHYERVVLKLSGESLSGSLSYGIDHKIMKSYVDDIKQAIAFGVQIAIVLGGGNIYRGSEESETGIEKSQGDYMGMLATLINSIALQAGLEHAGISTRLMSAIKIDRIAEYFVRRRAIRHMEKGRVVIFGAGTGNPYFTTDTAASLRAVEIGANILLKGTRVEGIYEIDPELNSDAKRFKKMTYNECIERNIGVMDTTAFALCKDNNLPICVFNIHKQGNLIRVLQQDPSVGTIVSS